MWKEIEENNKQNLVLLQKKPKQFFSIYTI